MLETEQEKANRIDKANLDEEIRIVREHLRNNSHDNNQLAERLNTLEALVTELNKAPDINRVSKMLSAYDKRIEQALEDGHNAIIDEVNKIVDQSYLRMDAMGESLLKLERYFDDDKFHNVLTKLRELEEEFHIQALQIVTNVAINKQP